MPQVDDYTALLSGSYWGGIEVTNTPVIVTYSFPTAPPAYLAGIDGFTGDTIDSFGAFNSGEQQQARDALGEWAAASGIVFIEVAPGQGDINFQLIDFDTTSSPSYSGAGGIAFYPFGDWNGFTFPSFQSDLDASGDVFMNSRYADTGTVNYGTLLHEIGHAIGLKHPTETVIDYATDPDTTHDQVLSSDDPTRTVMATVGDGTPGDNVHLHPLDQDAAAAIYGAAGTGAVVTDDATGSNSVLSNWSWDAGAQILTETGFAGDDTIRGSSVSDVIHGLDGANHLYGLSGDDQIDAGSGNDFLDGGPGTDIMAGGLGDDTYAVDNAADIVSEAADGGYDTVYAFASYTLAANVERLQVYGSGLTGTGNALDNRIFGDGMFADTLQGMGGNDYIVGGTANDVLDGGSGDDQLFGGLGSDTASYASAAAGVTVRLTTAGAQDTVGAGIDTLSGIENLTGSAYNDLLAGDSGNNVLHGGLGGDTLVGGLGNDLFYGEGGNDTGSFASAANAVTVNLSIGAQNTGQGTDTFIGVESIVGSAFADTLTGNSLANTLTGNAGNDTIDGGAGLDYAGYATATAGVTVSLLLEGGAQNTGSAGSDTLVNIENLLGSAFNDTLTGDAGNNVLQGGAGDDLLTGGAGNDTLLGAGGIDTASYAGASAGVHVNLFLNGAQNTQGAGTDIITGVENVTGSAFADVFLGNGAANTLNGGAGNDTLNGSLGADTLTGGAGQDRFQFTTALGASNIDTIIDFTAIDDTIVLASAIFTALAPGALAAGAYNTGTAATQADDRIVYNAATGALFYDADGVGGAAQTRFATLATGLTLSAADFTVS